MNESDSVDYYPLYDAIESIESVHSQPLPPNVFRLGYVQADSYPQIYFNRFTKKICGYNIEPWKILAKHLDLELQFVPSDRYGNAEPVNGSYVGVFKLLQDGEINATLIDYTRTVSRIQSFKSSRAFSFGWEALYSRQDYRFFGNLQSYFVYDYIFCTVLSASIAFILLLEFIDVYLKDGSRRSTQFTLVHACNVITSHSFLQTRNISSFLYLFAVIIIFLNYNSAFAGNMAVRSTIDTHMDQVVKRLQSGTAAIVARDRSFLSEDELNIFFGKKIRNIAVEPFLSGAIDRICNGDVAELSEIDARTAETKEYHKCSISRVAAAKSRDLLTKTTMYTNYEREQSYSFFFQKKTPNYIIEKLNIIILKLFDDEKESATNITISNYYWRHYLHQKRVAEPVFAKPHYEPTPFQNIQTLGIIYICGILLSLVVFMIEVLVHKWMRK